MKFYNINSTNFTFMSSKHPFIFVMQISIFKAIIYLFLFLMISNDSVVADFLENLLQQPLQLTNMLGLRKSSKLSLFEMLTATNPKTPSGDVISQGDIVMHAPEDRKGVNLEGDLWPNGLIPYTYHESVDDEHKNLVLEAMKHWEEKTCIQFRPKTNKDRHFIRFRTDTAGCWSSVGRQFYKNGPQDISLGSGCFKFYTAVHEIGHSVGFFHEHARKDRDKYIQILWDNVKSGMDIQFEIRETRNEVIEYDYRSIMHYPAWAFSKAPLKKSVLVARNPFHQYQIDEEKESLSFREKCPNIGIVQCRNNGFLYQNKTEERNCTCHCPPGFKGEFCELTEEKDNTFDPNKPKCGGNITAEGPFSTPNYPSRKVQYESCSYWIRAPINHRVEVTFDDFSFGEPYSGEEKPGIGGLCLYESIEIRNSHDIYSGDLYCGEQIAPKTVMQSMKRDFIIIIVADDQMKGRGLKANVRFIADQTNEQNNNRMQTRRKSRKNNRLTTNKPKQSSDLLDTIGLK